MSNYFYFRSQVTSKVFLYDIEGDQLKEVDSFPMSGNTTELKFSPNNALLAACSGKKQVKIVETSDFKVSV